MVILPPTLFAIIMIKLIGFSTFDSNEFYHIASQALGRSITIPIDSINADSRSPVSWLVSLCELLKPGQNYYKTLKNPGSTIRHLFYIFFAAGERDFSTDFAQHTSLSCHATLAKRNMYLHIVSGNLEQWRLGIINGSSLVVESDFRQLINLFHAHFEQNGFKDLWDSFSKQSLDNDQTFILLGHKK